MQRSPQASQQALSRSMSTTTAPTTTKYPGETLSGSASTRIIRKTEPVSRERTPSSISSRTIGRSESSEETIRNDIYSPPPLPRMTAEQSNILRPFFKEWTYTYDFFIYEGYTYDFIGESFKTLSYQPQPSSEHCHLLLSMLQNAIASPTYNQHPMEESYHRTIQGRIKLLQAVVYPQCENPVTQGCSIGFYTHDSNLYHRHYSPPLKGTDENTELYRLGEDLLLNIQTILEDFLQAAFMYKDYATEAWQRCFADSSFYNFMMYVLCDGITQIRYKCFESFTVPRSQRIVTHIDIKKWNTYGLTNFQNMVEFARHLPKVFLFFGGWQGALQGRM